MKGYAKGSTKKKIWCDKSRGWVYYYPLLEKIFDEKPKVICMVRDLREVVASMEALHRRNIESGLIPHNEIITTEERVRQWLGAEPIGRALRRVKNAVESRYEIFFVLYEDLCNDPQKTMEQIDDYCGLDRFKYNFKKIEKLVAEDETAFGYKGLHQVEKELRPAVQRAEETLGKRLATEIHQSNLWYQNTFKYGSIHTER